MTLTAVALANVRNYAVLEFAPVPGLNVFVGRNAQGKSNLLEAIGLLATGKSFRTPRESEVVRRGLPSGTVSGSAQLAAGSVRLACTLACGTRGLRKLYTLNGNKVRYAAYLGRVRVVAFVPAHLALVTGSPAARRALINGALAQENPRYYAALAAYTTFLAQKNAVLRDDQALDETLLATYDQRLIEAGTTIVLARHAYVAALAERARIAYRAWAGDGEGSLEVAYEPDIPCDVPTPDGIAAAFAARLEARRPHERIRRMALVGPQRDDVSLRLGEVPLAAYGSQGQQRSAVLALKLAEYGVCRERAGEAPLLLLDDVFSELDAGRQRAFVDGLGDVAQAFITTAHAVQLPSAASYRIEDATLQRVA